MNFNDYQALVADYFELPLDAIATENIAKNESRIKRGTLPGSGDNR
jgi:hypothetical protein